MSGHIPFHRESNPYIIPFFGFLRFVEAFGWSRGYIVIILRTYRFQWTRRSARVDRRRRFRDRSTHDSALPWRARIYHSMIIVTRNVARGAGFLISKRNHRYSCVTGPPIIGPAASNWRLFEPNTISCTFLTRRTKVRSCSYDDRCRI